jgi:hypothetical protein
MMRWSILPLALSSLALGCTSYHLAEPRALPPVTPPPGLGRVCVVRTSPIAMAVTFPVRDNGALVGATRGPGGFCYDAEPGHHTIAIEADEPDRAEIEVEPGGRYFLLQEVENVFGYVRCRSAWIAERVGEEKLADVPYRVLVGVPGRERLPGALPYAAASRPQRRLVLPDSSADNRSRSGP